MADGGNLAYIPEFRRESLPVEFFIYALQSNLYGSIRYVPKDLLLHGISAEIKEKLISERIKLIEIQRSRGYSTRESIDIQKLEKVNEMLNKQMDDKKQRTGRSKSPGR